MTSGPPARTGRTRTTMKPWRPSVGSHRPWSIKAGQSRPSSRFFFFPLSPKSIVSVCRNPLGRLSWRSQRYVLNPHIPVLSFPSSTAGSQPLRAVSNTQLRRTYYSIKPSSTLSDADLTTILKEAVNHSPTAYNNQSTRAILVLGQKNTELWKALWEAYKETFTSRTYLSGEGGMDGRRECGTGSCGIQVVGRVNQLHARGSCGTKCGVDGRGWIGW